MTLTIETVARDRLADYASVPIAFEVRSVFAVEDAAGGMADVSLSERAVQAYRKDYDALADGGPLQWPDRFDISTWGIFVARSGNQVEGGAAVAWDSPEIHMLEGRRDLAVLWDLRVRAQYRRRGIGTALFNHAADWAKSRGCVLLKIETQNVNVAACRFYARMGCQLASIDREAYRTCPEVADEIMLVWHLDLGQR